MSDKFVFGKLFAVIGGHGMHFVLDGYQELTEALANGDRCSSRQLSKERET